jgi:hypothetical protein
VFAASERGFLPFPPDPGFSLFSFCLPLKRDIFRLPYMGFLLDNNLALYDKTDNDVYVYIILKILAKSIDILYVRLYTV